MFDIDVKSRVPIYEQLIERIKQLMLQEVLQVGDQLPSVRALAGELAVNPNTIQKAYRELEREGFVYSLPGKGSFVNDMKTEINSETLKRLKEDLERIVKELYLLDIKQDDLLKWIQNIDIGGEDNADKN